MAAGLAEDRGMTPRPSQQRYRLFDSEVVRLYQSKTGGEIADELELPRYVVYRILRRNGIARRDQTAIGTGHCIDCGRASGKALRCEWHQRLRHAETVREWNRKHRERRSS